MNEAQIIPNDESKYDRIGGWLILVGFGLVITPFYKLYVIYNEFQPLFSEGVWTVLTSPDSHLYHPLFAPLFVFELVGNTIFGLVPLILLVYFFKRLRMFPKIYIVFLASQMVFMIVDYLLANSIPLIAEMDIGLSSREIFESFVAPAVWIWYFLSTERVNRTFVN